MNTQTEMKIKTISTTRVLVGTMFGALGLSAAMGMLMGYEFTNNGNHFFPDEAYDRFVYEEVVDEIDTYPYVYSSSLAYMECDCVGNK